MEVYCEPENTADKYAVCVKTGNGAILDILKKEELVVLKKPYSIIYEDTLKLNGTAKITGKRFTLGDGKRLQDTCRLHMTGLKI